MPHPPLHRVAVMGLLLAGCTALGGSEDLGGGAETFTLTAATPNDGAVRVPVSATITLTFSSLIDPASVTSNTLHANVSTFGSLTVNGNKLTFDPAGDLIAGTTYVFDISPELKGTNGHAIGPVDPYGFKTDGIRPDTLPTQGPRPR